MTLERGLDDAPLHTRAAAVDESNLPQTSRVRLADVFIHHGRDVPRMKGVEIEGALDGDVVRMTPVVRHSRYPVFRELPSPRPPAFFSYDAVTTVLMPPRTEKSPTTVIRLGLQAPASSSRMRFVTAS